jgi:hypothetical protein
VHVQRGCGGHQDAYQVAHQGSYSGHKDAFEIARQGDFGALREVEQVWTVWMAHHLSPHPMRHCGTQLGLVQELTTVPRPDQKIAARQERENKVCAVALVRAGQ